MTSPFLSYKVTNIKDLSKFSLIFFSLAFNPSRALIVKDSATSVSNDIDS